MGLFNNAKQLTKLGSAVANVKIMLDRYENDPDASFLIISAWICKVGITNMIEKNHWLPNNIVFVPINGHQTKMTMMEVQLATISRLMNKVSQLYDDELESKIKDVLDGGPSFYELDAKLPTSIKDIIETPKFT